MVAWLKTFLRRLLTWRKLVALFAGAVLILIEDRFAGWANDKIDAIIERHSTDFTLALKAALQYVHMTVWALVGLMVLWILFSAYKQTRRGYSIGVGGSNQTLARAREGGNEPAQRENPINALTRLRAEAANRLLHRIVRMPEELAQWEQDERQWRARVEFVLRQNFAPAELLRFQDIGQIQPGEYERGDNPEYARQLIELRRRLQELERMIVR